MITIAYAPAALAAEGHTHASADEHPLGVLHPVLVHFPVGLGLASAIGVFLLLLRPGPFLRAGVTFTITLAAVFAVPALLLGHEAADAMGRMAQARADTVELHESWGLIATLGLVAAALLNLLAARWKSSMVLRRASLMAILVSAGLTAYVGYLGGEVVRGPDHLSGLFP